MLQVFELIEMWKELMQEMPGCATGESEVDVELFKNTMKETFYYLRNIIDFDMSADKYMLPINATKLYGFVFAYATYNATVKFDETYIFEATQHVAQMLCDAIMYWYSFPEEGTVLESDFGYIDKNNNSLGEFHYNVETGDLTELVVLTKYIHENGIHVKNRKN